MKNKIITFLVVFNIINLRAQEELSLHLSPTLAQSNFTNPAFTSSKNTEILFPSFYYNLYTPDFTVKKLFALNSRGVRSLNEIASNTLKNINRVSSNINIINLGIVFKASSKTQLTIAHSYNANTTTDIDGVLIKALANDYTENIGKTIPFTAHTQSSFYQQLSLGGAFQYNERLNIGIRFKVLKGITGLFSRKGESLVTIEGYNYATSYINDIDVLDFSVSEAKSLKSISGLLKQSLNIYNLGLGLDLGISYKVAQWQFSASMIDALSFIRWNNNGKNYIGRGFHRFSGIGSISLFQGGGASSFDIKDTLKSILGLQTLENARHTQYLPSKTYISSFYKINEKLQMGALLYHEQGYNNISKTDLMLNATYKVLNKLELGTSWSSRNKRWDNFGIQLIGSYKNLQIYGLTDNILSAFTPLSHNDSNARLGINLIIK